LPVGAASRGRHAVRRALAGIAEAIARELATSVSPSWVGRLDPRAKIVGVIALVVTATLLHHLGPLLAIFVLALGLVGSARIAARRVLRMWIGVPLFSLAIILPATLNLVTPGARILTLCHFAPEAHFGPWPLPDILAVTRPGLIVAARFLLRSFTCVTLVFALVATTDAALLLNALRRLGMPRVFGMTLTMAHRYLVVILRVAEEIHLAKISRTIGAGSLRREQHWVAAGMGMLFRRTHHLALQVHAAMLSRGYDGNLRVLAQSRWRLGDWVWLAAVVFAIGGLMVMERIW
jgi:cobalt/nickel transport system permease protein